MRILMAAGGTGGHLVPAIRIAQAITRHRAATEFLFVGSDKGFEESVITPMGLRYEGLPARGFVRSRPWRNVPALASNLRASRIARQLVDNFAPDAAVGCGGYASYFPIRAARAKRIPYVLQEQNRIPGLATRWLSGDANCVFAAFEQTRAALPKAKTITLVGNPVDPRLASLSRDEARRAWNLSPDETVILVTGGSGGARSINTNIIRGLNQPCPQPPITVLWQTGRHRTDWDCQPSEGWNVREFVFTDQMTEAFVAADMIIARSGALTISEIAAAGRPAILVPFPFATADHQTHNAQVLVEAGGAELIVDRDLQSVSLLERACRLLGDLTRRQTMADANKRLGQPDASDRIAEYVISLAESANTGDTEQS